MTRSPAFLRRRAVRVAALSAVCLATVPAVAGAATATSDGTTATVTGTDAREVVDVRIYAGQLTLSGDVTAGAGCTNDDWGGGVTCPGGTGGIDVSLAGGDDRVSSYLADAPDRYGRFDLGTGADFFEGYGAEVVRGGAGNDTLNGLDRDDDLDGGDGDDKVDGGDGADVIRGGAGDDTLKSDPMEVHNPDVIDGGPGRDTITDWMHGDPATAPVPTVTLDGNADDGFPGEGDNVTNMEVVESYGALRFVGTDGDDIGLAAEVGSRADLKGLGGNDQLRGTDRDDAIDGGAGNDDLQGGYGNDAIVGGPGQDKIVGDRDGRCNELHCDLSPGSAADTIDARDGEVDTVACGPGQDTVLADAADVVAADCETVTRAAGAGAGAGGAGAGGAGAGGVKAGGTAAAPRLVVAGRPTLRSLAKGGLTVTLKGRNAGAKVTVTLKRGGKVVGTGRAKADPSGTAKVKVKLTAAVRRALKRARTAKLTLVCGTDRLTLSLKR